jgi:hypothetical protein
MFKRMFQFSPENEIPKNEMPKTIRNSSTVYSSSVVRLSSVVQRESEKASNGAGGPFREVPPVAETFDELYASAGVQAPGKIYTILKVAEMLNNRHLADMTPDAKRNSLMMALEAAAVEIGDLLQDAVARNRALDEYEEKRQEQIKTFESGKAEENRKLQAELEGLTSQYMSRIQANLDLVAREQDNFRAWQKRKQQETQRITDSATFCVPQGNGPSANSLTAVLERATVARR